MVMLNKKGGADFYDSAFKIKSPCVSLKKEALMIGE
jgi:hypothetical protein